VRTASGRIKAGKAALTIIRRGNRKHLTVKVPRRVIWRGAITLDPKAKPDARRVRDALLEGS
jgi:formylmethanofuran dehydrogenase subunit E